MWIVESFNVGMKFEDEIFPRKLIVEGEGQKVPNTIIDGRSACSVDNLKTDKTETLVGQNEDANERANKLSDVKITQLADQEVDRRWVSVRYLSGTGPAADRMSSSRLSPVLSYVVDTAVIAVTFFRV